MNFEHSIQTFNSDIQSNYMQFEHSIPKFNATFNEISLRTVAWHQHPGSSKIRKAGIPTAFALHLDWHSSGPWEQILHILRRYKGWWRVLMDQMGQRPILVGGSGGILLREILKI